MNAQFKPEGYNSVSPYLIVDNAPDFIRFIQQVFDAKELTLYKNQDDSVMHAEFRIDDSVIMLSNSTANYAATSVWMHVYVNDSDAVYRRALDFGCAGIEAPVQKGDPDKRGTFKDLSGNYWAVATRIS